MLAGQGHRVGIVDTDIQSPGIHVLFDLAQEDHEYTLNDYLWGTCRIEQAACDVGRRLQEQDGQRGLDAGRLWLVPSSIKATDIARILREGFDAGVLNDGYQALIETLKLDYLFLDTHPGLNEETLLGISVSDTLVLIMRPDQQDFQGTAVTVSIARQLGVPHLVLVLNRVLETFDEAALRRQVEQAYEVEVGAMLPNSDDLMRLASGGIFSLRFPDHRWSQALGQLANQLAAERVVEPGAMAGRLNAAP
jgi:MinD-like ATPase involved in chromosome partitioning or flagellar assembly